MSLTVSAAVSGGSPSGMILTVRVLDNATVPSSPNTVTGTTQQASIIPVTTGGKVFSAVYSINTSTPSPVTGNTQLDSQTSLPHNVWGTYALTGTTTAGSAVGTGDAAGSGTGGAIAVLEVEPAGTIGVNASTPASVKSTTATTLTTAAFSPPAGKTIVALVTAAGTGAGTCSVTDTYGLSWTAAAEETSGTGYAGVWVASTPAALAITGTPGNGSVGTAYTASFASSGGYGSNAYSVTSGALPGGLSLSSAGVISGTPTTTGVFSFTVTVTDSFGSTAVTPILYVVINEGTTPGGTIRQTWSGAAPAYFYGTLEVPVANTDHDWLLVAVSWQDGEDSGIAYVADDARNFYRQCAISPPAGTLTTQVFAVPNARVASKVYVSVSAYVRYLTVVILDVTGLQPGFTVDASSVYQGGALNFTESLSGTQPDFVLAVGAFAGAPQTVTQSGSGASWTALGWAGINGTTTAGLTQSAAWAATSGAATPSMQFSVASSAAYSGCIVAFYKAGGLPANSNPAWPVIKCEAAFGYIPNEPTAPPVWTDITSRFRGLKGNRGRSFELDEIAAADMTVTLDNFDGALSPQNASSPYYPNVTLVTPIRVTATWQGRMYPVFTGIIQAIPQTYDFQRGLVEVKASDDWAKLTQDLLAQAMIQEMLYDKPVSLWPLNEQQGATEASNWSSRSVATLTPTAVSNGGGAVSTVQQGVSLFGFFIPLSTFASGTTSLLSGKSTTTGSAPTPAVPSTGFGNSNSGTYPTGLAGTQDSFWGNSSTVTNSTTYRGSVLVDSNDSTLPLTSTGSTYAVWAQMWNLAVNTSAVIMSLTDSLGTAGTHDYLTLSYNGTNITVTQTAGSRNFTPPSYLFDTKWHLWAVTISTGGTITVYVDGVSVGSFAGTMPAGTPSMLQWGGDTTATTASAAGIYTGCQYLAGCWDRVVDAERIAAWYQSGATGFLDELAGMRIQRILAWTRWSAPQAIDPGMSMQQQFNYLGGGYASNGLSGAVGNYATAGGAAGVDTGAQADMTAQDIASTENGGLFIGADGTLVFRQSGGSAPAVGLDLGDMDYAFNAWEIFESGLGPWTATSSATVAQSSGWSYAAKHSALITVTGTPAQAYAWGDRASVTPGTQYGFSCWVMSPQGCSVNAAIDWFTSANVYISTSSTATIVIPPLTPVFLSLTGAAAPGAAAFGYPHPVIASSPATGTQLYFDRPRLSLPGFQCPYEDDLEVTEDIQYLYNDIVITRNVDQAGYRVRDTTSRARYFPRVYNRTVYSSPDDLNAVPDCANSLLTDFSQPALRVSRLTVDAASNPEAWPFTLSAGIGDQVNFSRTPTGGAAVTGSFVVLSVETDLGKDTASFTYVLAPAGAL